MGEMSDRRFARAFDRMAIEQGIERFAVEDIEGRERAPARTAFLHRRLVEAAPRIGETVRIDIDAADLAEKGGGFARDARAPVDDRAEHVECQRLYGCTHTASATISRNA